MKSDFLDGNFLASEERVPITEVKTNATRASATNGLKDHIWDNFSSETYKTLPAVGAIDVWNPIRQERSRGRCRPRPRLLPSAVAGGRLGARAVLHNNAVGKHVHGVSVDERMEAFDDAITKLLWPEKRDGAAGVARDGQSTSLWLTTQESCIQVPESYIHRVGCAGSCANTLVDEGRRARSPSTGPIPKGTPVNLLANTNLELNGVRKAGDLASLLSTVEMMKGVKRKGLTGRCDQETLAGVRRREEALPPQFLP